MKTPQVHWISVARSNCEEFVTPNLHNCGWRRSHTSVFSGKTHEFGNGEGKAKLHYKELFSPPEVGTRKCSRVGNVGERKVMMLKMVTGVFSL